jgi:hypothetical protein
VLIQITKRADGAGVLRCIRADGSITWQKQNRHAAHFALHDLTHYAVETVLGAKCGFFGLVAKGWEIEDTTGKGTRGPLPPEAVEIEQIVGFFDTERASAAIWSVEEFHQCGVKLAAEQIAAIRARRSELFQKWFAVPPGGALDLNW